MPLEKNKIVAGQYLILKEIHVSKSIDSKIFLTQNIEDEKVYVLKALFKQPEMDEISELFNREIKSLNLLNHPNIVTIFDSGEEEGFYYIILENLGGSVTLEKYIESNSDSILATLRIFKDVLLGVNHAHDLEIIHRDLSPSNILITSGIGDKDIKIIDFGISKIRSLIFEETTTVNHYHNILYSSPEQRDRERVSSYSDIYSLGCILLFMLSKKHPKSTENGLEEQIQNLNVNNDIKRILLKATNKVISSRFTAIETFINDINHQISLIENKDTTLHLKVTDSVVESLHKLGVLDFPRREEAQQYIKNSSDYFIYRTKNNEYHLISGLIKYRCVFDKKIGALVLKHANSISDYSQQENEIKRAFPINSNIDLFSFKVLEKDVVFLNKFMEKVDDEYRSFVKEKNNKKNEDRLIGLWTEKIKKEESYLHKKKNIGYYSGLEKNIETGYYYFEIDEIDDLDDIVIGKKITFMNNDKVRKQMKVGEIKKLVGNRVNFSPELDFDDQNFSKSGMFGIDYSENLNVTRRARRALETLSLGKSKNKNLLNIIVDPSIGSVKKPTEKIIFANNKMDDLNKEAVVKALGTQDIFLIQGPPGTGKSTVINELIYQIKKQEKNSKILLASQSHVAVDHIFNKLKKYFEKDLLVRVGNSDKISKESESNKIMNQTKLWTDSIKNKSITYIKSNHLDIDEELEGILERMSASDFEVTDFYKEYGKIEKNESNQKDTAKSIAKWYKSLDSLESFDQLLLDKASIIASTCTGIASNNIMDSLSFDWVIIDEAAKSTVPEILIPMTKGKKVILVGDHKQLPPIVNEFSEKTLENTNKNALSESLFEDLFTLAKETEITLTLSKQFRMHPAISNLIDKVFYTDDVDIVTDIKATDRVTNYRIDEPIAWLSTERLSNNQQQETNSKSFSNVCEAQIILKELKILEKMNPTDKKIKVGIISAYNGQKAILEKYIFSSSLEWKNLEIVIENVDAFQGSEVDVVFYSIVRSNMNKKIGFLSEQRRLNVALSRAKSRIIIVGNALFMKEASKKEHNYFEDVLIHMNRFNSESRMEVLRDGNY